MSQTTVRFRTLSSSCLLHWIRPVQKKLSGECSACEVTAVHIIKTMILHLLVWGEVLTWGMLWKKRRVREFVFS